MPRERYVTRRLAPVVRMKHVSLIEGPPLPFVDGSGVAVADGVELAGLAVGADDEADAPALLALGRIQLDGHARLGKTGVDREHGADRAIDQAGLFVLAAPCIVGELHAV